MLDTIIAVLASLPTIYLAYISVFLAVKPPRRLDQKTRRFHRRGAIIAAPIAVGLIAVQAFRNEKSMERIAESNKAWVDANVIVDHFSGLPGLNTFTADKPIALVESIEVTRNNAKDVDIETVQLFVNGHVSEAQNDDVWKQVKMGLKKSIEDYGGQDSPEGAKLSSTIFIPMPPVIASMIRNNERTL